MKTQHRITGTILAIALAVTTAAPAASPPRIKLPPKAPAAVKVPAAPKVPAVKAPAAPKIVSAPKTPAVKAPAAPKLPATPVVVKVPAAVKTPVTPKVPAVTTPAIPKIVQVPQAPQVPAAVKTPAAPRIPTVKSPSAPIVVKAVSVPVTPKTSVTPRLPVTPKIVTLPSTVKTPAAPVKAPDVSRVAAVREVKVPAVAIKRPTVIVPPAAAPKVHAMGGGKPRGFSKATLVANSGKRAAIAEAVKNSATVNRGDTAASIRSTVEGARSDNPANRLAETFLPDLPKTTKGRDSVSGTPRGTAKPGTGERTVTKELFDSLTGKGGGAGKGLFADVLPERDVPSLQDINQTPGFDQGFGTRPDVSGFDPGVLKPMNGISNNSGIGGPLGDAANQFGKGVPSGGVAGMGKSLIKDGAAETKKAQDNNETARSLATDAVTVVEVAAEMGKLPVSAIFGGGGAGAATVATAVGGVAAAASIGLTVGSLIDSAYQEITGSSLGADWADLDQKMGLGIGETTVAAEDAVRGLFGQPDPENEGTVDVNIYDLSPGLAQHIGQSRLGKKGSQSGNGDVKPADDHGTGTGRVAGAEISPAFATEMKNNLVGNPGQRGVRESGGGSAMPPARSNGAGTITPTDDQNTATSGGRQEDPGDFFGNGVRPDQGRLNGGNSGSGSSSSGENQDDTKSK